MQFPIVFDIPFEKDSFQFYKIEKQKEKQKENCFKFFSHPLFLFYILFLIYNA